MRKLLSKALLPMLFAALAGADLAAEHYLLPMLPQQTAADPSLPSATGIIRALGVGGTLLLFIVAVALRRLAYQRGVLRNLVGQIEESPEAAAALAPPPERKRRDSVFLQQMEGKLEEIAASARRSEKKLARLAKDEMPEGAALLVDALETAQRTQRDAMQLVTRSLDDVVHHINDLQGHLLVVMRGHEAGETTVRAFRRQYLPAVEPEPAPPQAVPEAVPGDPPKPDGAA